MSKESSQKFIQRNRAPRVQIEYDVHEGGSERKVRLPFVMGVMADLAGKPATPPPPVAERQFAEIAAENFDANMETIAPRLQFAVPNALSGTGSMDVELNFRSMDDFAPDAVARQIEPLRRLLEAREQLTHLLSYIDGKARAESFIENLLRKDKDELERSKKQLSALSGGEQPDESTG